MTIKILKRKSQSQFKKRNIGKQKVNKDFKDMLKVN